MPVWKLTVEYDGTRYYGWQEQKSSRTVAGDLRKAAEAAFGAPVELSGAGRTDAGVHALGQVARLQAAGSDRPGDVRMALNDRLPADINILRVEEAPAHFHARHDAVARYYLYQISTRRSAFAKKYVWWVKSRLDDAAMGRAAQVLSGRHDFSLFCERRGDEQSTQVEVVRVEFIKDGDLLLFRIGASHFLWKMVRRLVGALVAVGRGTIRVEDFERLVRAPTAEARKLFDIAANTAPPSGLFFERVLYDRDETPPLPKSVTPVRKMW